MSEGSVVFQSTAARETAQRKFSDVQIAMAEAIALVDCVSFASSSHADGTARPDMPAACDGIKRMLEGISNKLSDLAESANGQ